MEQSISLNFSLRKEPPFRRPWPSTSIKAIENYKLLVKYGEAYNVMNHFQNGVSFISIPNLGFTSFLPRERFDGKSNLIFLDPVVAKEDMDQFIERLLSLIGPSQFVNISENTAQCLHTMGYDINEIGDSFNIDLKEYDLQKPGGDKVRKLRASSRLGDKGFTVEEVYDNIETFKSAKNLSDQWKGIKTASRDDELKLITRPAVFAPEWGVRKFFCYKDGQIVAYAFFDPHFRDGKCVGYGANILRYQPGIRPNGVLDFTINEAAKVFKKEGMENLSLGYSPLYNIEEHKDDRYFLRKILQLTYEKGNFLYSFKGLAFHKSRYPSSQSKVYAALKDQATLPALLKVLKAVGLL